MSVSYRAMRWQFGIGGSLVLFFAVCVPSASADVWLKRDGSGVLQFSNAPTAANPTLLFREVPPVNRGMLRNGRSKLYDDLIRSISARHGVEFTLVKAVIRAESGFNPRAVSHKGARGLMQLMPETARLHRVRNVFSPQQNIEGGVEHLRMLLDRYAGNVRLALAAYNAGVKAVERAGMRIPPYRETQQYVRRVLWYRAGYLRDQATHSVLSRR